MSEQQQIEEYNRALLKEAERTAGMTVTHAGTVILVVVVIVVALVVSVLAAGGIAWLAYVLQ